MKTCTIRVTGKQDGDIELGIAEALRRITAGFTSGFDSNDSGSFHFEVEGTEETDDALGEPTETFDDRPATSP